MGEEPWKISDGCGIQNGKIGESFAFRYFCKSVAREVMEGLRLIIEGTHNSSFIFLCVITAFDTVYLKLFNFTEMTSNYCRILNTFSRTLGMGAPQVQSFPEAMEPENVEKRDIPSAARGE